MRNTTNCWTGKNQQWPSCAWVCLFVSKLFAKNPRELEPAFQYLQEITGKTTAIRLIPVWETAILGILGNYGCPIEDDINITPLIVEWWKPAVTKLRLRLFVRCKTLPKFWQSFASWSVALLLIFQCIHITYATIYL